MQEFKMYQKTYLVFFLIFFTFYCQNQQRVQQRSIRTFKASPYIYKFSHNQIFLKVYVKSSNSYKEPEARWALLDSGSTVNLMLDNELERKIWDLAFEKESTSFSPMEFHNLGTALPKDYDLVLGAPFFQRHCLIFEYGVPVSIQQNLKKKCFSQEGIDNIEIPNRISLELIPKNGLVHASVQIGTKEELMAIDTGSGMSSLPLSEFNESMQSLNQNILVMDIQGKKRLRKLYVVSKPIQLKQLHFSPAKILDSDEVWDGKEGYSSTLGVDFLKTFRVYIDFGSKILGIDHNEYKQGQNHSSNEWGSR